MARTMKKSYEKVTIINYKKGDEFTGDELDELGHKLPITGEDIGKFSHDVTVIIKVKD